ncbi:hypothetical protein [Arthrobacter sp. Leaf337]|nr:hypothetical protein [Arthrobacter sp. Leaf337]
MTSSEIDLPADYVELPEAVRVRVVTDARTQAQPVQSAAGTDPVHT